MSFPGEPPAPSCALRIDELVLRGFRGPVDRHAIAEATERELGRLLSETGALDTIVSESSRRTVDAGSFSASPGATPDAVGVHLARAIWLSIGGGGGATAREAAQPPTKSPPSRRGET